MKKVCSKVVPRLLTSEQKEIQKNCYAKGEFLQLNFLANNMCNIGAVIAQLVTV